MLHSNALRRRYGKSRGNSPAVPADKIDLEVCREGIREFRENPTSGIPIEEVMRKYGVK